MEDFNTGSELIVHESQEVIFMKESLMRGILALYLSESASVKRAVLWLQPDYNLWDALYNWYAKQW